MDIRRPTAASKAEETHRAAMATLAAETAAHERKTARLRALRLQHEEAMADAPAADTARPRKRATPAKRGKM